MKQIFFALNQITSNKQWRSCEDCDAKTCCPFYANKESLKDEENISKFLQLIKNAVADYTKYYSELKYIYVTGIYSPCYAVPGWSENTWYLKSFREAFTSTRDTSQFPYNDVKIEEYPPN